MDRALVTQVASFAHLLSSCKAGDPALPSVGPQEGVVEEPDGGSSVKAGDGAVLVDFQFSSLLEKSSVFAVAITAFSEGETTAHVLI